jgi:RimJ/RimL family protein N-acetyltransferase
MIETTRLLIRPLTHAQVVAYAQADHALENELGLEPATGTLSAELQEAIEQAILPSLSDKTRDPLYSTLWIAIDRAENRMVGAFCMLGEPNENGEVEIGYGTFDEFQGRGFMTEIVGGILAWAKAQPRVAAVLASTEKSNIPSHRVLERNHFAHVGETGTLLHWKFVLER